MLKPSYFIRVLKGVSFEKFNYVLDNIKKKIGQSKIRSTFDILWCAARYGAGYYDYAYYGFYSMNGRQRDTYITRVRNKRIIDRMNDGAYIERFNDKPTFIQEFLPFLRRRILNAETASAEEFRSFLEGRSEIIAKPIRGCGGHGIEKLKTADFGTAEAMLEYIRSKRLYLLEEVVHQHPDMARLHPESVNTLRIVTDRVGDQVYVAYVLVKIGRGAHFCDNTGQGGMFCRVDEKTGKICSVATDDYFHTFSTHPDTGIEFCGYQLPMVPETIEFIKRVALSVRQIGHIGWDVAIAPDGPLVIEGNADPGVMCQFAELTPEKEGLWPYYKRILSL